MTTTLFQNFLDTLYNDIKINQEGHVADYIPELLNVNHDDFAIAIVTVDGHVYQVGDSKTNFSIQSISKAFSYGMALEDNGLEKVLDKVDVEPSGEAFNSISLEAETGRPKNPMINAGAITTTGLVKGDKSDQKISRILDAFALYTGHPMYIDQNIYLSEKDTGHRNRAIAHLLKNYHKLEGDPEEALNAYFQQCSILVTCRDLALMGASLANNGVNPITGVRTLEHKYVANVLSVMTSCGMYDYSGNWTYSVGMPAKSGVGGGIVAVLPGQFGLAIYSPRLDQKGNSVRGIRVCEAFSKEFGLHMLHHVSVNSSSVIRTQYTGSDIHSKREYTPEVSHWLESMGHTILVLELMSELSFISAEVVISKVSDKMDSTQYIILDFYRVTCIDSAAIRFFIDLILKCHSKNKNILFVGLDSLYEFTRDLKKILTPLDMMDVVSIKDIDHALEWCENDLLKEHKFLDDMNTTIPFHQQPLCAGMTDEEITFLKSLTVSIAFEEGEIICAEGEQAKYVYFLNSGHVSISVQGEHKKFTRLSVTSSGTAFGESALLGRKVRSADVVADTYVALDMLKSEDILNSKDKHALSVKNKLFYNLSIINDQRLRRANMQIRTLSH